MEGVHFVAALLPTTIHLAYYEALCQTAQGTNQLLLLPLFYSIPYDSDGSEIMDLIFHLKLFRCSQSRDISTLI